jgi:hypothetical protein
MKSIFLNTLLCITLALTVSACSCQGQPRTVLGGPSDTTVVPPPAEVLRNLILDTVPTALLSSIQQRALALRYNDNPAISSYTVIQNPFPRADSLAAFRKLRCNLSATRVFTAERTKLSIDYTLNSPDLLWEGKLVGTGEPVNQPGWNWIKITTSRDDYVDGLYRFTGAALRVNNLEGYVIEELPPSYFVVVRYTPQKLGIIQDRVRTDLAITR